MEMLKPQNYRYECFIYLKEQRSLNLMFAYYDYLSIILSTKLWIQWAWMYEHIRLYLSYWHQYFKVKYSVSFKSMRENSEIVRKCSQITCKCVTICRFSKHLIQRLHFTGQNENATPVIKFLLKKVARISLRRLIFPELEALKHEVNS